METKLAPGTQVGSDVRLVRLIGEGAMGSVWEAEHQALGKRVAVKFIAAGLTHDARSLARFEREAKAAVRVDSPHAVRALDYGAMADGVPYIVMELLDGESLGERLHGGNTLAPVEALRLVQHVGAALGRAHELGIIHRDIKPDNIVLMPGDDGLVAKVLDFGMAKDVQRRTGSIVTATGVIVGTPEFMSPEQVLGSKDVDHRADLWALGAVVYRALTGRIPFTGKTPHALIFAICKGDYERPSELGAPEALDAWFERALCPALGGRFSSADELVGAFEAALDESDVAQTLEVTTTQKMSLQDLALRPSVVDEPSSEAETVNTKLGRVARDAAAAERSSDPSSESEPPASEEATIRLAAPEAAALGSAIEAARREAAEPSAEPSSPGERDLSDGRTEPEPPSAPVSATIDEETVEVSRDEGESEEAAPAPASDAQQRARRRRAYAAVSLGALLVAAIGTIAVTEAVEDSAAQAIAPEPSSTAAAAARASAAQPAEPSPALAATATADELLDDGGQAGSAAARDAAAAAGGADAAARPDGASDQSGYLTVVCQPPCARILAEERLLGSGRIQRAELEPGDYQLHLERPNHPVQVIHVTIEPGQETVRYSRIDHRGEMSAAAPPTAGQAAAAPDGKSPDAPVRSQPSAAASAPAEPWYPSGL